MKVFSSLDPRVQRQQLPVDPAEPMEPLKPLDQFPTYEVFQQQKTGKPYVHVGSVHAPNAEMAMIFAKEQYGRRQTTELLWVVASEHILSTAREDSDMFATTPEKRHRDPAEYKVRDRIEEFKQRNAQ